MHMTASSYINASVRPLSSIDSVILLSLYRSFINDLENSKRWTPTSILEKNTKGALCE